MRIGIYGGSFDPIHNGHLSLASFAIKELALDEIVFIPTYKLPKYYKEKVTYWAHRVNMLVSAISNSPKFCMSYVEIERKGISYTIDTVQYFLSKSLKNEDFILIGGPDCVNSFSSWKDYKEIEKLVDVKFAERDFYCPDINIRATLIRELVSKKLPISHLVSKTVEDYIINKNLYRK